MVACDSRHNQVACKLYHIYSFLAKKHWYLAGYRTFI